MTTFSFNYFGSPIEATSLGTTFIPDVLEVISSHCVPITIDGKIVAVHIVNRGIDIPGGHVDDKETAIEAMRREVQEEAQLLVDSPVLIDVWQLTSVNTQLGLRQKPYLLVYAARVTLLDDFISTEEADERLILEPEDFIAKYFGDKQQARIMINAALAALK